MSLQTNRSLAVDANALNQLKLKSNQDPRQAVREAAQQFEAYFANALMSEMRKTSFTDDDEFARMFGASKNDAWRSMLDQQMMQNLSKTQGSSSGSASPLGLVPIIEKQLLQQLNAVDPNVLVGSSRQLSTLDLARQSLQRTSSINPMASYTADISNLPRQSQFNKLQPSIEQLMSGSIRRIQNGQFNSPVERSSVVLNQDVFDPSDKRHQFVQRFLPAAQHAESITGIPAEFILGQAALESGWGRHEIKGANGKPTHNLFGIKATGWSGPSSLNTTTEYINGERLNRQERFRAYQSYEHAFEDYARLIANNPRYSNVANATRAQDFAYGLQRAGYATDPKYGDKLMSTIQETSKLLVLEM